MVHCLGPQSPGAVFSAGPSPAGTPVQLRKPLTLCDSCNCRLLCTIHFLMFVPLKVSKEEGLSLAREFSCPFFETSAAYRYYIDDVFHALVREIRKKEKELVLAMEKKSKPKSSVWRRLKSPFRKKKDSVT